MEWLFFIPGLVILVIVLVVLRHNARKNSQLTDVIRDQNEQLKIALARAEEKIDGLILDNARLTEDAKAERNKHFELSASNERLKSFYQAREEKIKEQKEEIESLQKKLTAEFENIAEKLLREKSIEFTEKNHTSLDSLLSPLKEQIKGFEKKVEDTYDKELRDKISLREELKTLNNLNIRLRDGMRLRMYNRSTFYGE